MTAKSSLLLSRRTLFKGAGVTLGAGFLPSFMPAAAVDNEPHYFLEIVFRPGWDPSYLCDGRPLAMTAAGVIQNYLGEEPQPLVGSNGGQALVTSLFAPLRPYFDSGLLSILNGVHMASTFDGHEQNLNFLFTGNPFGGDSFVPFFNAGAGNTPIDFLQVGPMYGTVFENVGNGLGIAPQSAEQLSAAARAAGPIDLNSPSMRYLASRFGANGAGSGRFSQGVREMQGGLGQAPDLATRIRGVDMGLDPGDSELIATMKLAREYLKRGITRNVVIEVLQYQLDTHDATSARQQPDFYRRVVNDIASVFTFLKDTPADDVAGRSLFDLTTVVVTSEFSRSMRQYGVPIDGTGTDHNPLNNTVLLAGKAIKGGQIIGASDVDVLNPRLSGAHLRQDPLAFKTMGKPFDFATLSPLPTLPDVYVADDYLSYASIANSLMKLYGVPDERLWSLTRDGPKAKLIGPALIG